MGNLGTDVVNRIHYSRAILCDRINLCKCRELEFNLILWYRAIKKIFCFQFWYFHLFIQCLPEIFISQMLMPNGLA